MNLEIVVESTVTGNTQDLFSKWMHYCQRTPGGRTSLVIASSIQSAVGRSHSIFCLHSAVHKIWSLKRY